MEWLRRGMSKRYPFHYGMALLTPKFTIGEYRDDMEEVKEPTKPTEFEVQAYVWNELRKSFKGGIAEDDVGRLWDRPRVQLERIRKTPGSSP